MTQFNKPQLENAQGDSSIITYCKWIVPRNGDCIKMYINQNDDFKKLMNCMSMIFITCNF